MGIAKKDQRGSEQDDNFCTRGLKKKQALNTMGGEWCFNRVGRQDCENSYVPHEVGAKGLGYYECVYNATGEEKCKPETRGGGAFVVYKFCSEACQVAMDTTTLSSGTSCNAQPLLENPRLASQYECESFSEEFILGNPSVSNSPATITVFPCKFQGVVDGIANDNCHPNFNGCNGDFENCFAACNCVAQREACADVEPECCTADNCTACTQLASSFDQPQDSFTNAPAAPPSALF